MDEVSEMFQRVGGHFQSKKLCCRFWELFTSLFEHELIQNSNFRVQGMFFNNCIEKNKNKTHFEEGTSESPPPPPAPLPPPPFFWNFSENSSVLEAPPLPNRTLSYFGND